MFARNSRSDSRAAGESFGWWPLKRARLDKRSRATFVVRGQGHAQARVVLVAPDWASPLNETRAFRLRG